MPPLNNISRGAAENTEKKELQSSRLCASVRDRLIGCPLGQRALSKQSGFTLMELVLVVVLLGIVAIISTQFVQFGVETYLDGASRQHMASTGRFVTERLSRELRNALPNSVRVGEAGSWGEEGNCLEYRPISANLGYLAEQTPIAPEPVQNSMQVVINDFELSGLKGIDINPTTVSASDGYAAVIYPLNADQTYTGNGRAVAIDSISKVSGEDNAYQINFNGSFAFAEASPAKRVFLTNSVVTWCYSGGQLFRTENTSQPGSAVLMGQWFNNQANEPMFAISKSGFSSGSLVHLTLRVRERDEEVVLNHEIHLFQTP